MILSYSKNEIEFLEQEVLEARGSLDRQQPRKTLHEVIQKDIEEWRVSKELVKDRNAWKSFIKRPI